MIRIEESIESFKLLQVSNGYTKVVSQSILLA